MPLPRQTQSPRGRGKGDEAPILGFWGVPPEAFKKRQTSALAACPRGGNFKDKLAGRVTGLLRILIADDESIIRLGLKKILEEAGHKVVASAPDGKKALELARTTSPDLAILDIKMPEMDGLEVAEILRRENPIPVIILTAYSDRELVERAREAQTMAYLVKPVKEADLLAALEIAVKRFEEWDRLRREKESLEEAIEAREMVEKAKRLLMEKEAMKESEAFILIHRLSRDSRRPMKEIAREIIERYAY